MQKLKEKVRCVSKVYTLMFMELDQLSLGLWGSWLKSILQVGSICCGVLLMVALIKCCMRQMLN